ncbi:MAG TPA: ABC transporter permease [Puia sp.]|nr:ABC transporter permease [Puia sp.]
MKLTFRPWQVISRMVKRYRSTFIINLIGLSTGLAFALLIFLWISDELAVDTFHRYDRRLYQVMINQRQGDRINTSDGTNGLLGEVIKKGLPEVEYAVTITPPNWFKKFNLTWRNNTVGAVGNFVGQDYFNVFSYDLLQGRPGSVLTDRHAIVLSRGLAMKLFNTTDNIIGKTLEWKWASVSKQVTVTGICSDFPSNSSYRFDFVLSLDSWKEVLNADENQPYGPSTGPFATFLVLKDHTDLASFDAKLNSFSSVKFDRTPATLFLRKYSDAWLHGRYENGKQAGGRVEYVRLFSVIGCFILLIACINFMNLSTARVTGRLKEIGLKKTFGAGRSTLVYQFLGESVLMSFIALIISLLLVVAFLPGFNGLTGKHLTLNLSHILSGLGITLLTGLIAGSYPALFLSRFKPVDTLRGKFNMSSGLRELFVRKGLVILQFTLSVIFIVSVLVVYNQIRLVQTKSPGYDKENVIYFEKEGNVARDLPAFLSELKQVQGVTQASSIMAPIIAPPFGAARGVHWEGKNMDDKIRFYQMPVNYDLIETLGIKMAAGRTFSREFATDSSSIVVNEAAVKIMGLSDPVGKVIKDWGKDMRIIGVTRDFHFNSLHEEIKPFIFRLEPQSSLLIMARLAKGREREAITNIRAFYKSFNPGYSFDYQFLDDDYKKQYTADTLVAALSKYFAGLAILLSCLGLFGLAALTAERRIKEIGIRKVLGAGELRIIYLLSADFTKIVLLSILLGLPLSYLVTRSWLDNFAYRIHLSSAYFIVAGLVSLFMAWATIGVHVIRTSFMSPVRALKEG